MTLSAHLLSDIAKCSLPRARTYVEPLRMTMDHYQITTRLRVAHFLAQVLHESGRLQYTEEVWGPTPAQKRYEGRADLGNVEPGDGHRFRGRGLIQLTGRYNYERYGTYVDVDVVRKPELVAKPPLCCDVAGWYWKLKGLNALADDDDVVTITKRINGGVNGLADRRKLLARAKSYLYANSEHGLEPKPPSIQ